MTSRRSLALTVGAALSISVVWFWAAMLALLPRPRTLGHGRQDALSECAVDGAMLGLVGLTCLALGVLCFAKHRARNLVLFTGASAGLLICLAFVIRPLVGVLVGCRLLVGDSELTASWMGGREIGTMMVKDLPPAHDLEIYCFTRLDPWCKGVVVFAQIVCATIGAGAALVMRRCLWTGRCDQSQT